MIPWVSSHLATLRRNNMEKGRRRYVRISIVSERLCITYFLGLVPHNIPSFLLLWEGGVRLAGLIWSVSSSRWSPCLLKEGLPVSLIFGRNSGGYMLFCLKQEQV